MNFLDCNFDEGVHSADAADLLDALYYDITSKPEKGADGRKALKFLQCFLDEDEGVEAVINYAIKYQKEKFEQMGITVEQYRKLVG